MAADNNCAVVYVTSSEKPRPRPCHRWIKCLVGLVVVASLSCSVVCLGVCMFTLQVASDLGSRLSQAESILGQEHETRSSLASQAVALEQLRSHYDRETHRRSKRSRRNRRGRRRSNRHRTAPTFVHLIGTSNTNDEASFSNGNFVWRLSNPNDLPLPGLSLESNTTTVTVTVNASGIYDVYSQIGLEGRMHSNNYIACGHRTVLTRQGTDTDLMESRVTQHNLGDAYAQGPNGDRYAFDTIVHRGTFKLQSGDILRVRRLAHCNHFRFRSNPTFAYFGVVQRHKFR